MDIYNPVNFVALFMLFVPFIFAVIVGVFILFWETIFPKNDEYEMFDDKDYPYERIEEEIEK